MKTTLYKFTRNGVRSWSIEQKGSICIINHGLLNGLKQTDHIEEESENRAREVLTQRLKHKLDREGYTYKISSEIPKIPMKVGKYEDHWRTLPEKVLVQPKYDGIRCIATSDALLSRRDKEITSCSHILRQMKRLPEGVILDGELYCEELSFQSILSYVKRDRPLKETYKFIKFYIFDVIVEGMAYSYRREIRDSLEGQIQTDCIRVIKDREARFSEIEHLLTHYTGQGAEGIIIRSPKGEYEYQKTSKDVLKLKKVCIEEFQIVDITAPEKGREEGAAIFICKYNDNQTFSARPRMSIFRRKAIYQNKLKHLRKWTRVTFKGYTNSGAPREPIAEGLFPTQEDCK